MLKKKIVTNRSRKLQAEPVLVGPGAPRPPPAAEPRPEPPPLRWRGPQGTRNDPDNFGSAAGGFTQAPGGWAGPKLESVEFPAFRVCLLGNMMSDLSAGSVWYAEFYEGGWTNFGAQRWPGTRVWRDFRLQ